MKKILTLLLVIALALGTFTGCDMIKGLFGGNDNGEVTGPTLDEAKRSEERRVGKECLHACRSRWSPYH